MVICPLPAEEYRVKEVMRVVFMGTPEFAVPTLQHLVNSEFSVVGVVCQPDRPSGRGKKIQFGPVKTFSLAQKSPGCSTREDERSFIA